MKKPETPNRVKFNPPLKIFSIMDIGDQISDDAALKQFGRPELENAVCRKRITQYFTKRSFNRSPLD